MARSNSKKSIITVYILKFDLKGSKIKKKLTIWIESKKLQSIRNIARYDNK